MGVANYFWEQLLVEQPRVVEGIDPLLAIQSPLSAVRRGKNPETVSPLTRGGGRLAKPPSEVRLKRETK
jgi:hypothetical protein